MVTSIGKYIENATKYKFNNNIYTTYSAIITILKIAIFYNIVTVFFHEAHLVRWSHAFQVIH